MNIDGNALYQFADGGVIAIIAILMVFLVLLVIILLTDLVTKLVPADKEVKEVEKVERNNVSASPLNINDEDATIACLIASIDYRNEVKKNIQVLSVKEVK